MEVLQRQLKDPALTDLIFDEENTPEAVIDKVRA